MARNRKPIEAMSKHLMKSERAERELAQQRAVGGKEDLQKAPSWLIDTVAKKEFYRVTAEMEKIQVIGNLDLGNIGGYCNSYSQYIRATKELKKQPLVIERETKFGSVLIPNPLINIQKKYAEEMRKFASCAGLTIDSRLKMATAQIKEIEDTISNEFGDI